MESFLQLFHSSIPLFSRSTCSLLAIGKHYLSFWPMRARVCFTARLEHVLSRLGPQPKEEFTTEITEGTEIFSVLSVPSVVSFSLHVEKQGSVDPAVGSAAFARGVSKSRRRRGGVCRYLAVGGCYETVLGVLEQTSYLIYHLRK